MTKKPKKPYKSFPLTPHLRGGWGKKYKGQQLYIRFPDPDEAMQEFHRIARQIDSGDRRPGSRAVRCATVGEVCNRYTAERLRDHDAGRLSKGAMNDYEDAAAAMVSAFGAGLKYTDVGPTYFTRLFRILDNRLGSHALARVIQNCRTIWKHAYDNEWIDQMPRFGSNFKKPQGEKKRGRGFAPEECRFLLLACYGTQLEAMILLMLNGGYTAKDCADLPRSAVDFDGGLISFPRPKMLRRRAVDRVMTMWPETADALRAVMSSRTKDDLVFRTIRGNPWVQGTVDSVRLLFQRLVKLYGWKMRGPSWLRHLHRTLSDELEKPHAAARLMGHRIPGISEVYIDSIEHSRIQEITDHIRLRIFSLSPTDDPAKS